MPTLHMLGHMVAVAVIATLVKQLMELNEQLTDLKWEQENSLEPSNTKLRFQENNCESSDTTGTETDLLQDDKYSRTQSSEPEHLTSSVWCYDGNNQMCRFTNLCYNSAEEEFVMFKGAGSVIENVNMVDGSFTVDLSSVRDHNARQTTIVSLPSRSFPDFNSTWVPEKTLVFKRFLPDNLMHMFHDDLLALHHTLRLIDMNVVAGVNGSEDSYSVQVFVFDDDCDPDHEIENIQFYEMLTKWKMKYKKDFLQEGELTCFNEIYLGLSKTTTWYDFGFTKPQGPIDSFKATGLHIRSTVNYILQHSETEESNTMHSEYLVLLTRKENRKILNEMDLTLEIVRKVGLKVINLSYDSYSLPKLINVIRNSRGVIGMHGSLLVLSMFLQRGSILIELFPYAVNPDNYTPYKTLTQLTGVGIVYKSWANQKAENTVGHSDWSSDLGGLDHLKNDQREIIMSQTEVPTHLCCSDPSWLYHIYQDTFVDTGQVTSLVEESLRESKKILQQSNLDANVKLYPSKVQNVACILSERLTNNKSKQYFLSLSWRIPWTAAVLGDDKLHYEILIQDLNDGTKAVIAQQAISDTLIVNVGRDSIYYVWVRCVINDSQGGPYSDAISCLKIDE